eukprot:1787903-Heterocapsa_arctica.AAC.1
MEGGVCDRRQGMKEQCGGRHEGQRVAEVVASAGQRVLSAGRTAEAAGSMSEPPTSYGRSLERRPSPDEPQVATQPVHEELATSS